MSLESQVAALVSAANKLTSEIAGKMKGIDKKVDEATSSVPNALRNMLDIQTWVDEVNGDDRNTGERSSSPKKTLVSALEKGVSGCTHKIFLSERQQFVVDKDLSLPGQNIIIYNNSISRTLSDRAKIAFAPKENGGFSSLSLSQGSLVFNGVIVRHPSADGLETSATDPLNNAVIRSVNAIVQLDYRYNLPTLVQFGDNSKSVLMTSDRALSTLILASSEAVGGAGTLASNRYGGATMLRIGAHSSAPGIKLHPTTSKSVSVDYLTP